MLAEDRDLVEKLNKLNSNIEIASRYPDFFQNFVRQVAPLLKRLRQKNIKFEIVFFTQLYPDVDPIIEGSAELRSEISKYNFLRVSMGITDTLPTLIQHSIGQKLKTRDGVLRRAYKQIEAPPCP